MSSKWRRFEVMLPLQFNDDREVPAEWLAEAVLEVVDHFGAASYETQKVEGHWDSAKSEGVRCGRSRCAEALGGSSTKEALNSIHQNYCQY